MDQQEKQIHELKKSIDGCIESISEKHRLHRKIKFLLDVRGLLTINNLTGDYVEFGVYRGEMMYAASRILVDRITSYIGLDTFEGLPEPRPRDEELFEFEKKGFMASPVSVVENMLSDVPHQLLKGDFREAQIKTNADAMLGQTSIVCIDCNWPSSLEAAYEIISKHFQPGTIVFVDDWFVMMKNKNMNEKLLYQYARTQHLSVKYFMTYPPCAMAFVLEPSE